jgi:hypothetical protein
MTMTNAGMITIDPCARDDIRRDQKDGCTFDERPTRSGDGGWAR